MHDTTISPLLTKKRYLTIAIVALCVSVLPYFILGENSHMRTHDNLDGNVVMYKILTESGKVFSSNDTIIPNMMNGLPRSVYPSELSVVALLYYLFGVFYGYVANQILVRVIAFIGMYLFLKNHVFRTRHDDNSHITILAALCFSLVPFFPNAGVSISGVPLIGNAFLNIAEQYKITIKDIAVIIIFPFMSSLVLSGIFIIIILGVVGLAYMIKQKRINYGILLSLSLLSILYLLVEYRLILFTLSRQFMSHRVSIDIGFISGDRDFLSCLYMTGAIILNNVDPAGTFPILQKYIIQSSFILALSAGIIKKDKQSYLMLSCLFVLVVFLSAIYGFYNYKPIFQLIEKIPIINALSFWRFIALLPFLWYLIFAISLWTIQNKVKWGSHIVSLLVVLQVLNLTIYSDEIMGRLIGNVSFREFYSADLFNDIKKTIDKDQSSYRVASLGIHPAITLYNGFYTIDGYCVNYPMEYKKAFRRIISKELDKNKQISNYFDKWGSRCYIFTAEQPIIYWFVSLDKNITLRNLELDTAVLKKLGCEYLISAVTIEDYARKNLELVKTFENKRSPYKIRLYKVGS